MRDLGWEFKEAVARVSLSSLLQQFLLSQIYHT